MSKTNLEELLQGVLQGSLISCTLSFPLIKGKSNILKVSIRALMIKGKLMYQVSKHESQKIYHSNLLPKACSELIEELLQSFKQGIFTLQNCQYHVLVSKQNKMTIIRKDTQHACLPLSHNKQKNYVLQEGVEVPFLSALGIMSKDGKIVAKKYDKFRQINRFLEIVRDVIHDLPKNRCLEIIDFGCGKAYLTFALHYYLHEIEKREVHIQGLDLKKDVIQQCQQLAKELRLEGISFAVGDINDFAFGSQVDMMIALHACDTATDAALEKAVRANAEIILCVPCCQHELYTQVKSENFDTLLRHGILRERFAALVTDAARADLLTMLGYKVQVLEFIDMEHTPKNLLLRAVKGATMAQRKEAKERYQLFKKELAIIPSLEKRFL